MNLANFRWQCLLAAGAACLVWTGPLCALELPTQEDARLIPAHQANRVWNGVTTTRDGRVFKPLRSACPLYRGKTKGCDKP